LALSGLEQMSHVWVIFVFHEAKSPAKPLVRPPRAPDQQIGVYATRSPYRPNPLGQTLAQVDRVEEGKLFLKNVDLLDGTPILDLKTYVAESDRPENPRQGWIEHIVPWTYALSESAQECARWLMTHGLFELEDVLEAQLGTAPLQPERKRLQARPDGTWVLAYRTWRFAIQIDQERHHSTVLEIFSGYSPQELQDLQDPYSDKDLHRAFRART